MSPPEFPAGSLPFDQVAPSQSPHGFSTTRYCQFWVSNKEGRINYHATADYDAYNVTLNAGTTYTIEVKGRSTGNGPLFDPYMELHDADGYVDENDDGGENIDVKLVVAITTTGTYSIVVSEVDLGRGTYVVSVTAN